MLLAAVPNLLQCHQLLRCWRWLHGVFGCGLYVWIVMGCLCVVFVRSLSTANLWAVVSRITCLCNCQRACQLTRAVFRSVGV